MKRKTKNIILSTTAVGLACTLAAGAFLQSGVSVAASAAMMPGIEGIVNSTTAEKPFRILEIVDDKNNAEIGYYISGQEPFLKLYDYNGQRFSTVEEALAVLLEEERLNLMRNRELSFCGENAELFPIDYKEYEECYFVQNEDTSWKQVDFKDEEPRTVEINGHYEEVEPGTGDYVKGEMEYYPVRQGTNDADRAKYVQNIKGFRYSGNGQSAPYLVNFQPVMGADGSPVKDISPEQREAAYDHLHGGYGYYVNIYRRLTTEINISTFPGEKNPVESTELEVQDASEAFGDGTEFSGFCDFGSGEDFGDQVISGVDVDAAFAANDDNPMIYLEESRGGDSVYRYKKYLPLNTIREIAEPYSSELISTMEQELVTFRENGDYSLWIRDESGNIKEKELYYVMGHLYVPKESVQPLPDDYYGSTEFGDTEAETMIVPYYYEVSDIDFSCIFDEGNNVGATLEDAASFPNAYRYTGWYDAFSPDNEEVYLETENNATYYTPEDEYVLKPGQGDYIFVPDENEEKVNVQVNHLFYRGGYINHDWMKRYVFHLNPDEEEFHKFGINVTTLTSQEFAEMFAMQEIMTAAFSDMDGSFQDSEESFSDTESPQEEVLPVEMMISEGQETVETEEAFVEAAELEDINDETVFSDTEELSAAMEEIQEEPFTEEAFISEPETAFAAEAELSEAANLTDFDLIYINGNLVSESAAAIAESRIPCIINSTKTDAVIQAEFADFMKEDADGHYVNGHAYFFKNEASGGIVNGQFHENFNTGSEGDFADENPMEGFEEILEYIESENQYRELGQKGDNTITDGSESGSVELLSTEISQARAVEYIINYIHRRVFSSKPEIHVLEIQPAKSQGEISKEEILHWLGYNEAEDAEATVKTCCEELAGETAPGSYLTDGDENTYWHSNWRNPQACAAEQHYITIQYKEPVAFRGMEYLPRQGSINGEIEEFNLTFIDAEGGLISQTGNEAWNQPDKGRYKVFRLEKPIFDVTEIEIRVTKSKSNNGGNFASGAELVMDIARTGMPWVDITTMTSSEFAGHIEDINVKYDMIYWGTDDTRLNDYANFRPESYLYYHIGKAVPALYELQGLMYQDYVDYHNNNLNAQTIGGNIGLVRGSGNDITAQQKEALLEFVGSGYPVILGNGLVNGQQIDTTKIDNSSYVYQFMEKAKNYPNVITETEVLENQNLSFYMDIPKPVIKLQQSPPDATGDANGPSNAFLEGDGLSYRFMIENDAESAPAAAGYNCELYLDLNCDGNYSPLTERMGDIEIRDSADNVVYRDEGRYNLKIGKEYTLRRSVPEGYSKLIAWKLEISSNQNSNIRTAVNGYTKRARQGDSIPEIKVLQIKPASNCTWDLAASSRFQELFQAVADEFLIHVQSITIPEYNQNYDDETGSLGSILGEKDNNLSDYDMLIIGFGDGFYAYGSEPERNISETGIKGIQKFIDSGRSVIFAHDTTSSSVVDPGTRDGRFWKGWAYNVNMQLRAAMGMDRYGITENGKSTGGEISEILRNAGVLSADDQNIWEKVRLNVPDMAYMPGYGRTKAAPETHGFSNAKLRIATAGRGNNTQKDDVSRVTNVNEGAITEYPYKIPDEGGFSVATTHAQYYQAALEADMDGDERNDAVVWYCLTDRSYADSPNDVRNNYYIYSNRNVYYTGVGHSKVDFDGNETEMKLFVNTIIAAYRASVVSPKIEYVSDFDMDAPEQEIVYYMTDQASFDQEAGNLLNESQEFYFRVKDDNLISTAIGEAGERNMEVEFYITPPAGTEGLSSVNGITEPVVPLEGIEIYRKDGNRTETVSSGNVYRFRLDDMYQYLMENRNYRNDVRIYIKVTTKYKYFGQEIDAFAVDSLSLRQRQLFDMD